MLLMRRFLSACTTVLNSAGIQISVFIEEFSLDHAQNNAAVLRQNDSFFIIQYEFDVFIFVIIAVGQYFVYLVEYAGGGGRCHPTVRCWSLPVATAIRKPSRAAMFTLPSLHLSMRTPTMTPFDSSILACERCLSYHIFKNFSVQRNFSVFFDSSDVGKFVCRHSHDFKFAQRSADSKTFL